MTPVELSTFAKSLTAETAFTVLAIAKKLQAAGKDVVELEIGDSPFNTSPAAKAAGIEAIEGNHSRYCASPGLPELRETAARYAREQFGIPAESENVVVGSGAKVFEQFFCEAFLNPGDGVLVFSPYFPTYVPNILRRGARPVFAPLRQANDFRPDLGDIERFLVEDPSPKGIFLNSPHNPTGGVATEEDLKSIADMIRGKQIAVFSDEPYCHMVWKGRHHSAERMGTMINTTLSCTPPFVQLAGKAALEFDSSARDSTMAQFRAKVGLLTEGLNRIDGFHSLEPRATFYVFPNVAAVCNRLGVTSHGLALYLLEGADDDFGVACLGGECFGDAGAGFLRLSCAASDERLEQALAFIPTAIGREDRVSAFLEERPELRLTQPYPDP